MGDVRICTAVATLPQSVQSRRRLKKSLVISVLVCSVCGNWETKMTKELEELIERSRKIEMTPDQAAAQRRSFAYGNTHIENERITRELIEDVDRKIAGAGR